MGAAIAGEEPVVVEFIFNEWASGD